MEIDLGIRAVLILIGFTASIGQIVLLRELLVVFSGNEMSFGWMLAGWLFWTAMGSGVAGGRAMRTPRRWMAGLQLTLAVALPGTVLAIREGKAMLSGTPGEILGPGTMLIFSLAALSLFCLGSGALFTASSRVYSQEAGAPIGRSTGTVYLWEAAGSAGGGLLAGLVLLRYCSSIEIAAVAAVLNVTAAVWLTVRPMRIRAFVAAGAAASAALLAVSGGLAGVEKWSQERSWRGFQLLTTSNSVYGSLAVVATGSSRSVYESGTAVFHAPDPAAAEEAVHYALLQHPAPRRILLIGGGLNGSIAQALQSPGLIRLDYVELDPAILELARTWFAEEWRHIQADQRVHVHIADGRLFLKATDQRFDVVIVNLPDPQTAQLNRFFTVEFFKEAARRLTDEGVISFQVTGAENYIGPELAEFLRSVNKTLQTVFPEAAAIPGEIIHFFGARRPGVLVTDAAGLLARLGARHLQTRYVSEYFIPSRMAADRMRDFEEQTRPLPQTRVNRDFEPIAYYFDMALWASRFHAASTQVFRAWASVNFVELISVLAVGLLALAGALRLRIRAERRLAAAAGGCAATMGFTLLGLQMMLLLAFQAMYGYVYQQLAILMAAFMAGMAAGSAIGLRAVAKRPVRALVRLQILAGIAPLGCLAVFANAGEAASAIWVGFVSQAVFPLLALLAGIIGGAEFPIASRIFFDIAPQRGAGTIYALDLAGSCAGAVFFAIYLLPVFGFLRTAVLIAVVAVTPLVLAIPPVSRGSRAA